MLPGRAVIDKIKAKCYWLNAFLKLQSTKQWSLHPTTSAAVQLTEYNPYLEANSGSASQVIVHLLRNLKVHHRIHTSPLTVPILNQTSFVRNSPTNVYFQ